ncbi:MAG: DNA-3-methyladenine glycosylase [Bacteroidota bacterium]|nr:DNA-3-methyladenine glycosylase [Bacteroidota bacterium]
MNNGYIQPLPLSVFQTTDVVAIAQQLLGKLLITQFQQQCTIGRIVETEAYAGITDKASHAYGGRYTPRTQTMYAAGGCAYVYLCYGIHYLFNVVTGPVNTPHAVLIRAIEPVAGLPIMLQRMGKVKADYTVGRGPGNVTKAMGINRLHNAQLLHEHELYIGDDGYKVAESDYLVTQRIGVDYAGDDALLPYRFLMKGNKYVSGKKLS